MKREVRRQAPEKQDLITKEAAPTNFGPQVEPGPQEDILPEDTPHENLGKAPEEPREESNPAATSTTLAERPASYISAVLNTLRLLPRALGGYRHLVAITNNGTQLTSGLFKSYYGSLGTQICHA